MIKNPKIYCLNSSLDRCGIKDYNNELYSPENLREYNITLTEEKISPESILKAPFQNVDIIHLQHEFAFFGPLGILSSLVILYLGICRLFGTRLLLTVHSTWDPELVETQFPHYTKNIILKFILQAYLYFNYNLMSLVATQIVVLNTDALNIFKKHYSFFGSSNVHYISIGYFPGKSKIGDPNLCRKQYQIADSRKISTCLGFTYPNKGFHLAIEAVEKLKKSSSAELPLLFIAGGEPKDGGQGYFQQLKRMIIDKGLEKDVIMTGYLEDNDPMFASILTATDVFIYPYQERTTASGSLSSILNYKKPIIASDIEYFREYDFLLKFKENSSDSLADVLEKFLTKSEFAGDYQAEMNRFLEENSPKVLLGKYLDLLK